MMADTHEGRNGGRLKSGGTKSPGRPRKLPELDALIADVLGEEKDGVTAAAAILKKWRQMAAAGNLKAGEMLFDRGYGKPTQSIQHATDPENPLPGQNITLVFNAPNVQPITSEEAMQALLDKFKDDEG